MPKKRKLYTRSELKAEPKMFSCQECGSTDLRGIHVAKGFINVQDDDGTVTKEEVKKRYRDCQGCGARYVTFESIIYKVNRQNAQRKQTK